MITTGDVKKGQEKNRKELDTLVTNILKEKGRFPNKEEYDTLSYHKK